MAEEIHHSEAISIAEVKQILLDRLEESGELSYMQRLALEHAQLVSRTSADVAKKLVDDLIEKFRLSTKGAITLANFLPDTIDEIRQLLGKEAIMMETETVEEILNTLSMVERLSKKDKERIDKENIVEEEKEVIDEDKEIDESMIPEDLR